MIAPANQTHTASALTAHVAADDESSADDEDHRRLDTETDLLEEFLENEGKILRLPIDNDKLDIDDLTQVMLLYYNCK